MENIDVDSISDGENSQNLDTPDDEVGDTHEKDAGKVTNPEVQNRNENQGTYFTYLLKCLLKTGILRGDKRSFSVSKKNES